MGMRSSSLSCCSNKTLVQDQVCTDWSITGAGTQIVYTNNITQEVYGSGYVKYDVGANPITVDFLVGATVVDTITVQPQSSGTFTVRYFTTVRITTTGTTVNQGEFCITVRYPISKKAYRERYAFFEKVMKLVFYKQHVNSQQYLPSKYSEGLLVILIILTDCKFFPVYDIVLPGNTVKILVVAPTI